MISGARYLCAREANAAEDDERERERGERDAARRRPSSVRDALMPPAPATHAARARVVVTACVSERPISARLCECALSGLRDDPAVRAPAGRDVVRHGDAAAAPLRVAKL